MQDKKENADTTHRVDDDLDDEESDDDEEEMEDVNEEKDLEENEKQIAENKDSLASGNTVSSDEVMALKNVDINKSVVEDISQDDCMDCKQQDNSDNMETLAEDHSEGQSKCDKESSEVNTCMSNDRIDKSDTNDKEQVHTHSCDKTNSCECNSTKVLNGLELLDLFRTLHKGKKHQPDITSVGMVS